MILLQNPNIPVATNPVEIDAAIIDILSELNTNLSWLDNGYGRAYKNADARNGGILFFPEVYLGTQNNSQRYLNVTPDNDKGGSCFFFVSRETITEFQIGQYGFLNYQMAIIFSCNMELIQSNLLSTEYYQQNLISQVRDVLSRQLLGKNYQLTLQSVEYLVENVFAEFDIQNTNEVEKAPYTHFRMNCSVVVPEQCPVPTLLPVLDCKSIDLDGVNEYLGYGIYPTPLPSNTNFLFSKTEQFSFSIWFKIDSFTGSQVGLIATGNFSVQLGYQVNLNSSSGQAIFILTSGVFTSVQGSFTKQSADAIIPGQYNNVICTYNGDSDINNMKIYVNGIDSGYSSVTDNGLAGDISYPTTPLKIFRGKGAGTTNGKVNNVRIWRGVALNPSQALAEYNSGVPMFTAVESANLVLDLDIQNADWDGSQYNFPNKTGITNDLIGYNTEESDLINECPE